jgi:hypothetical protein
MKDRSASRVPLSGCLLWQSRDKIHRLQHRPHLDIFAEGVQEDGFNLSRTIDVAERPVDCQTKIFVAAWQRERIRFDSQINVSQRQLLGCLAVPDKK